MLNYFEECLKRLQSYNPEENRDRLIKEGPGYAGFSGVLQVHLREAIGLAESLLKELKESKDRIYAMELAVDAILNHGQVMAHDRYGTVSSDFYAAADMIQNAMSSHTPDKLRSRVIDGISTAEFMAEKLLDESELCVDCGDYRNGDTGDDGKCASCREDEDETWDGDETGF